MIFDLNSALHAAQHLDEFVDVPELQTVALFGISTSESADLIRTHDQLRGKVDDEQPPRSVVVDDFAQMTHEKYDLNGLRLQSS
jgi:hypothetical protein